jgi:Tol biopolymer transport system component
MSTPRTMISAVSVAAVLLAPVPLATEPVAGLVGPAVSAPGDGAAGRHRVLVRVSVAAGGAQGNSDSYVPSLSADGRFVAFISDASNLVPGDTNGQIDVFVRDQRTRRTTRVSVGSDGTQGNNSSLAPQLSADGRYVAFGSYASNLVPGDTNAEHDAFVHDRWTGRTTRVSVAGDGTEANQGSSNPVISHDGRYLCYTSNSGNLVPGDTNGTSDAFVYDQRRQRVARVSVTSTGAQANNQSYDQVISGDGRYIAYASLASNLVPDDTNGLPDLFLFDRRTGHVTRISVADDGAQADADAIVTAISRDGRYILYWSPASNLVPGDTNAAGDSFVYDQRTRKVVRVSVASDGAQANGSSFSAGISADGRKVTYLSEATNLVAGDTNGTDDVFLHDRVTGRTTLVSVSRSGQQANGPSTNSAISADGRHVALQSDASNLVPSDTNARTDVFAD